MIRAAAAFLLKFRVCTLNYWLDKSVLYYYYYYYYQRNINNQLHKLGQVDHLNVYYHIQLLVVNLLRMMVNYLAHGTLAKTWTLALKPKLGWDLAELWKRSIN